MGSNAFAEITVDKSSGVLTVTSDINGIIVARVIGPDDGVMADESYSGSSLENKGGYAASKQGAGAKEFEVRNIKQCSCQCSDVSGKWHMECSRTMVKYLKSQHKEGYP